MITERLEKRFNEIIVEKSPLRPHERNERFRALFEDWYERKQREAGVKPKEES